MKNRREETHDNEKPKPCPKSAETSIHLGVYTPHVRDLLPNQIYFIFNKTWSQRGASGGADGVNLTDLVRQRQQMIIKKDYDGSHPIILRNILH